MLQKSALAVVVVMLLVAPLWPAELLTPARAQNGELPFRQEITLPELTSEMQGQPVDIRVRFKQPCWAADPRNHSVRVYYDDGTGSGAVELPCQIYDLERGSAAHITACKLVFLLQGPGDYTLAYSSSETAAPGYTDHVSVGEGSYFYEPVPGYSIDLDYYSIHDDELVYGVGQRGDFFGIDMAQKVIKQLPDRRSFEVQNWGQLASYAFFWYEGRDRGTDEQLVSKEIVVDGPLMSRVGIRSSSRDGKVETTAYYTYYHSPGSEKRLLTSVHHEVQEQCRVDGLTNEDGVYAYLLTVRARSSSIDRLNLGDIPPYLHVNTEDHVVHEYRLDQNPESTDYKWLLDTRDDIDMDSPAWVSIDDGDSGTAYALLFNTTSPAASLPGMQVRAVGRQEVSVPGLEVDGGGISCGRNAYERDGSHNLTIPAGFTATFTSAFYATQQDGITAVQGEVTAFERLKGCRLCSGTGITGQAGERHRLSVTAHLAPSLPLAPALSLITGRQLPATTVELWRNDTMISSSVASRIPLDAGAPLGLDLGNVSLFKTAVFPRVPAGRYTIRVKGGLDGQRYIGMQPVTVTGDTETRVLCRLEGSLTVAMHDHNNEGIEGIDIRLLSQDATVASNVTGSDGTATLKAPMPATYTLQARHRGFILHEQQIRLPHLGSIALTAGLHSLDVTIHDALGMPPGVQLQPVLTSSEMTTRQLLQGERRGDGHFYFERLPTATYTLRVRYKSFTLEQDVEIPGSAVDVTFPATYRLEVTCRNARGIPQDCSIAVTRNGQSIEAAKLPPGSYHLAARSGGDIVAERDVFVTSATSIELVTAKQPLYPLLGTIIVVAAAGLALYMLRRRLNLQRAAYLAAAALLLIAPLHTWWQLHGSSGSLAVTTSVYLLPAEMVTIGEGAGYTGGDIAGLPSLFAVMGTVVAALTFAAGGLLVLHLLYMRRRRWLPLLALAAASLAVATFAVGMSMAAEVVTGGLWGSGRVTLALPGIAGTSVAASWSPALGFWLAVAGIAALLLGARSAIARGLRWLRRCL